MNRAERRRRQRSAQAFDTRQTFSKKELEEMNSRAFQIGTAMALYATQQTLKLGPTRMDRIRSELKKLETKYIENPNIEPLPFDVDEMNRWTGKHLIPKGEIPDVPTEI